MCNYCILTVHSQQHIPSPNYSYVLAICENVKEFVGTIYIFHLLFKENPFKIIKILQHYIFRKVSIPKHLIFFILFIRWRWNQTESTEKVCFQKKIAVVIPLC